MSIDQRLREGLRATNDALPVPDIDVALAAVTADARRTRRRTVLVGLAAAAAVIAVIVGVLAVTRDGNGPPQPADPSPPTRTTETVVNGRIQALSDYLGEERPACAGCRDGVFDQDTGTVLFSSYRPADPESASDVLTGIRVVSPEGTLADLTCGDGFTCPGIRGEEVVSGPGPDELTFWTPDLGTADQRSSADHQLQVMGFDGTARFTMDVTAGIPLREHPLFVTWSPEGNRLAVTTREFNGTSRIDRIWLVHRDGGAPQLVHTASDIAPESDETSEFSPAEWSPDGSRLGFVEEQWSPRTDRPGGWIQGQPTSTRIVSLLLPEPGQEPGARTTLREFDDWCLCSRPTFLWSPDGTRVAVIEPNSDIDESERVLELSAADGAILAQHPLEGYPLVWPVRQP